MLGLALILALLCVIIVTPPASEYEISIYDAYPVYFWIILIGSVVCGISILLIQAFSKNHDRWWIAGLSLIILANSIFLFLPEFRGYALYGRWDTLSHLGYIRDILDTGHTGEQNLYPLTHILAFEVISVAQVSIESILPLFFVLFSALYIVNMHLLSRHLSANFGKVLLVTAFAAPLIYSLFHVNINPNILAIYSLPLLLYFYHRREQDVTKRFRNSILMILLAFSVTFFHPIVALFAISVFAAYKLAHFTYYRFVSQSDKQFDIRQQVGMKFTRVALIMLVTFTAWYLSFMVMQNYILVGYDWLTDEAGISAGAREVESAAGAEIAATQLIELFIYRYGAIMIMLVIAGISCLIVIRRSLFLKKNVDYMNWVFTLLFLLGFAIFAFEMLAPVGENTILRTTKFPLFIGVPLCGLVLYDSIVGNMAKNSLRSRFRQILLPFTTWLVILTLTGLCIGSTYASPRTNKESTHVTQMEIDGFRWIKESRNPRIAMTSVTSTTIYNFVEYMDGLEEYYSRTHKSFVFGEELPTHFGYDEYDYIAQNYDFRHLGHADVFRYIYLKELDKAKPMFYPENVRGRINQWTETDFIRLMSDPSVDQIYANDGFEVWRVHTP